MPQLLSYMIFVLAFLLLAGIALKQYLDRGGRSRTGVYSYKPRQMLSENEQDFMGQLKQALPEFEICPQVSLGAFLEPRPGTGKSHIMSARNAVGHKRADFVICRPRTFEVLAVLELDDSSHKGKRSTDALRDRHVASAGIPTVRWESAEDRSPNVIRKYFVRSGLISGE